MRSVTNWLRATNSTLAATSAMQMAPTMVMMASLIAIERFENKVCSLSISNPVLDRAARERGLFVIPVRLIKAQLLISELLSRLGRRSEDRQPTARAPLPNHFLGGSRG